ncbi:hypothetical protein BUE93_20820 [Chromobacterium amazonense]|uniref:Uncharacterized protein n=1 Tax=Chromobacterium amazonense TaxID=1382803 RepID=A0A2S9WZ20_9NEIS|nr:HGGxSTG domain-containing protein [Chromobacterium amazonense]PRP68711.1 hypothetical protein BUE93_20820 [Chromobacterium amazonense]
MPKCGAKTRSGGTCQRNALRGSRRCALHGGKSTGPKNQRGNKNAASPGSLYSQFLTEEERAAFEQVELGRIDDELRLQRIRLARALRDEQEADGELELDEQIKRIGGGPDAVPDERKFKRRDYVTIIDKITARIESLEKTRAELLRVSCRELDDDIKRLEIEKRRKELTDPDDEVPTPVKIVVEVKDARKRVEDAES